MRQLSHLRRDPLDAPHFSGECLRNPVRLTQSERDLTHNRWGYSELPGDAAIQAVVEGGAAQLLETRGILQGQILSFETRAEYRFADIAVKTKIGEPIPADLPNRIKELRKRLGMTQKELAGFCTVSQVQIISNWESGKDSPSPKALVRLGKARFAELRAESVHNVRNSQNEIERAMGFLYLVWHSFGAKGEHFGSHTIEQLGKMSHPIKRSISIVREVLQQTAGRLSNVLVDRRDFADCIDRYDSRDTFFYLDPPYTAFQPNGRYQPISEARLRELFAILKGVRGKFLLSFNDAKIVRESARGFCIQPVSVLYSLGANSGKKAPELLIANYPLKPVKT